MMKTNQDYKNAALAALKGNWTTAVLASVILMVISTLLSLPSTLLSLSLVDASMAAAIQGVDMNTYNCVGFVLIMLIVCPLAVGAANAFRRLLVDGDGNVTSNMIDDTLTRFGHNFWGMLLMCIYVSLWSLLLVVPGIVKSFSYAMTPFILKDYPELTAHQAICLSNKMMKGHKWELFWFTMSFMGWAILGVITFGILNFWLTPYIYTALAAFYQDVKAEYIKKNA